MPNTVKSAQQLRGIFPALFTPLKRNDSKCINNGIDFDKAAQMIEDLIDKGIHGLVPMGTTGQSATVTPKQHVDFIRFTLEIVQNRVPVIAGAGSNCTRESIDTIKQIQDSVGNLAFLCVTGYYNTPPQEGLIKHFITLAEETGAPLVLYNVPGRTNNYMEAATILKLAEHPQIIGLKQAVDFKNPGTYREDTSKIIQSTTPDSFAVLTGEDDSLCDILKMGGSGMISATANIPEAAHLFKTAFEQFEYGNSPDAEALQNEVMPYVKMVFMRKNPIPLASLFNSPIYLPMVALKDTQNGAQDYELLMKFISEKAPSLHKYF